MTFTIFVVHLTYQVSDKRLLKRYGNGESFLAETETFLSNLRDGVQGEPKFERDILEYRSSCNHQKENPDVLSRLGQQAGSKNQGLSDTAQQQRSNSELLVKIKICKEFENTD